MEKPILFNTAMVQAIQKRAKTSTRRPIKKDIADFLDIGDCLQCVDNQGKAFNINYPYQVGDTLYVRETFYKTEHENYPYFYKADKVSVIDIKWKPSIHMPRKAARLFLKVTDVRIERLQDITEEHAIKEGCEGNICEHPSEDDGYCPDCDNCGYTEPPQLQFLYLWDSIYSKQGYGWKDNPYVWVIEFEKVK